MLMKMTTSKILFENSQRATHYTKHFLHFFSWIFGTRARAHYVSHFMASSIVRLTQRPSPCVFYSCVPTLHFSNHNAFDMLP